MAWHKRVGWGVFRLTEDHIDVSFSRQLTTDLIDEPIIGLRIAEIPEAGIACNLSEKGARITESQATARWVGLLVYFTARSCRWFSSRSCPPRCAGTSESWLGRETYRTRTLRNVCAKSERRKKSRNVRVREK